METVKLMISTNKKYGKNMLNGHFGDMIWASDNMETVAHYYEGSVIEIEIALDKRMQSEYVRDNTELAEIHKTPETYRWGSAEMRCPAGAIWYSFSRNYLLKHLKSIREIHPDLSAWQDD